jgi:hypothetical protein
VVHNVSRTYLTTKGKHVLFPIWAVGNRSLANLLARERQLGPPIKITRWFPARCCGNCLKYIWMIFFYKLVGKIGYKCRRNWMCQYEELKKKIIFILSNNQIMTILLLNINSMVHDKVYLEMFGWAPSSSMIIWTWGVPFIMYWAMYLAALILWSCEY